MIPIFTLLAIPAVLAFPAARPDELITSSDLAPRAYFANAIITDPDALKWYQPVQDDDNDNSRNNYAASITADTTTHASDTNPNNSPGAPNSGAITSTYQCFTSATYPPLTSWLPFSTLWAHAAQTITANNPSTAPSLITTTLHSLILSLSAEVHLDARILLAVILQESSGILAAPCTGYSATNCGLMQGTPGSRPFDPLQPAASIERMLRDGIQGHEGEWPQGGPGLAWWMGAEKSPWKALRGYNTGSVPAPQVPAWELRRRQFGFVRGQHHACMHMRRL
ncbi:hypothetical protein MPH_07378 [Macrophomina phaseolina MS6]|uniref:Uncharacterized protein n=1 Tax=Macrophomina phaseolina (strain MS6) TaxID=1126212 RepID=K2QZH6_MACPH|nr:hypothetical protein MPH_07378 [Macrophomina phaseolina MS6]